MAGIAAHRYSTSGGHLGYAGESGGRGGIFSRPLAVVAAGLHRVAFAGTSSRGHRRRDGGTGLCGAGGVFHPYPACPHHADCHFGRDLHPSPSSAFHQSCRSTFYSAVGGPACGDGQWLLAIVPGGGGHSVCRAGQQGPCAYWPLTGMEPYPMGRDPGTGAGAAGVVSTGQPQLTLGESHRDTRDRPDRRTPHPDWCPGVGPVTTLVGTLVVPGRRRDPGGVVACATGVGGPAALGVGPARAVALDLGCGGGGGAAVVSASGLARAMVRGSLVAANVFGTSTATGGGGGGVCPPGRGPRTGCRGAHPAPHPGL